jgi:hypothetical protein
LDLRVLPVLPVPQVLLELMGRLVPQVLQVRMAPMASQSSMELSRPRLKVLTATSTLIPPLASSTVLRLLECGPLVLA